MSVATVYLIPTVLLEGQTYPLPAYILDAVKNCTVFFVENERTTRRFLKLLCYQYQLLARISYPGTTSFADDTDGFIFFDGRSEH